MSACGSCGELLQQGAKFCPQCGAAQGQAVCTTCGADLTPRARFCAECGTPVATGTGPDAAGDGGAAVTRRVTSVLFGDLVGFTSLSESRDQEEVRELLSRYFEECRRIVARYGGTIEKFIGDAVMAVWGVPTAHEDDAERAVRAGLELVSAVAGMREAVGAPDLDMRVGIVTGEVAVTVGATQQGMVAGDAVNTASRVQSAAAPGQVWVDETTRLLSSSAITFADAGSHVLKGKAEPVPLWSVRAVVAAVGGAQRPDGLEAPLVGRDRELRLVKELFHRVEESQRQAVLLISAEPGMGKSRLAWEFEKYVDGLSTTAKWHSGRCVSYGEGVAYYALSEAIRGRLEAGRQSEDQDLAALLDRALDTYVAEPEERSWVRHRLEVLLGAAGGEGYGREDLFAAWTSFLRAVSGDGDPVVLVIEDAHHADEGLVAFLEHLASGTSFPCFVMLVGRPELLESHPGLATNRRLTVLHLEELSPADMGQVLDGLVAALPAEVRASLVERAEGVPLYAVELVRSLIDRDLVLPRGGQYVLADRAALDLATLGAPTSLQTLVAARLDALPPEQRFVVSRASVLGTSFPRDALAALCPGVDLDAALNALVKLQIFRQEDSRLSAEHGHFLFVQTVVRQVAYGTLSRRDRRAAHLAVVQQLEAAGSAAELAPVVAQHYLDAVRAAPDDEGNPDLVRAAVSRLRQAAERARALGASTEAAAHLRVAVDLVQDDPRLRAEIERDLAEAALGSGSYEDSIARGLSAATAFDELGDEVNAAVAAAWAARSYAVGQGELARALELIRPRYQSLLDHADADQALLTLSVPYAYALERTPVGEHRGHMELDEVLQRSAVLAERLGDRRALALAWTGMALRFQQIGAIELFLTLLEAEVHIAREAHDRRGLNLGLLNLNAYYNGVDADRAAGFGREAVQVARTLGDQFAWESAVINLLIPLACRGDWVEVDALLEDHREGVDQTNALVAHVVWWWSSATGRSWVLPWEPRPTGEIEDPQVLLWSRSTEALVALDAGDAETAMASALEAVAAAQEFAGVSDDFFVVWLDAVLIARSTGRVDTLRHLFGMVAEIPEPLLARSLRAGRHHVAALLGIEDGEPADTVDRHFREAVAAAETWGGHAFAARFRTDHALWLRGQDRGVEADALLEQVRRFYEETGSTRWLADLDLARADAVTPGT